MQANPKIYSYVVEHDNGHAPNPYFGICTLCRCKFSRSPRRKNIVELAEEGDWIVGTGGASVKSAGHGKLVYSMLMGEKILRSEYFDDTRFSMKKRVVHGTYEQTHADNEFPVNTDGAKQFALISRHFYYFGANAVQIPEYLKHFEKIGPGFKSRCFNQVGIRQFLGWLKEAFEPGKQGEPCSQKLPKGKKQCGADCSDSELIPRLAAFTGSC